MIIGVPAMASDRPGSGRGSPAASRPAPAPRRRIPPAVAGRRPGGPAPRWRPRSHGPRAGGARPPRPRPL